MTKELVIYLRLIETGSEDECNARQACGKAADEIERLTRERDVSRAAIEQLHAAVKTAQELAARRLMEIERLKDALRRVRRVAAEGTTHTGMIAALGILVDRTLNPGNGPLPPDYTYHSPEPSDQRINQKGSPPGETEPRHSTSGSDAPIEGTSAKDAGPLFAQQMLPDTSPLTHQEIFSAVHHHAAEIVKLTAAVPAQCTQGASRDTSPELHAKGCPCPDCLNGTTRSNVEQFASRDASPADLVGALQDVVHTDTGPVRAGKAHRDAFSEFVCPNHGRVQQLTDSGDCPMCYQDRHAQRTSEQ